ncbi:MAG: SulP family inorganic anion transporter [Hellea sp.]
MGRKPITDMKAFSASKNIKNQSFVYNGSIFTEDLVAAIIVTILLVPQSLAYALLAGLPPQVGIYVSIFPLLAYALLGSSKYLNVGPTAVISIMTAASISILPESERLISAAALGVMTGSILLVAWLFKAGFIMNFVSRPVVSAYITGAAILIIISQLKHIFGVNIHSSTALSMLSELLKNMYNINEYSMLIGICAISLLIIINRYLAYSLIRLRIKSRRAKLVGRIAPILIVAIFIMFSSFYNFSNTFDLNVVGEIPKGLPPFSIPVLPYSSLQSLAMPAVVIAIVAFVDSCSTAQELAARSRSRVDSNKELLSLGASNLVAGMTGGYPINGSMSRSAVNFNAGGKTRFVGLLVAMMMALTAVFLTPILKDLPLAVLAALIIVACFSLVDFKNLWETWVYSRADGITAIATFSSVLIFGVQWGVLVGVILAMALHINSTLLPHMPLVGRFPGTEHYRDSGRFNVETNEIIKTLRVDESLYYANARYLEDRVAQVVEESPDLKDLVLMCTAVNRIDASALSSLEEINKRLKSAEIRLHFSDMQSRVKERLFRSNFLDKLSGQIFLSQHEAMEELEPEPDWNVLSDHIDIH